MTDRTVIDLQLPSGPPARAVVRLDHIIVAAAGRICCAHRRWMTPDQVRELADDLALAADAPIGAGS